MELCKRIKIRKFGRVITFLTNPKTLEIGKSEKEYVGSKIIIERAIFDGKRILYQHQIKGEPELTNICLRIYHLNELEKILKKAGFELMDVYGDYLGTPYSRTAPLLIAICKKILFFKITIKLKKKF